MSKEHISFLHSIFSDHRDSRRRILKSIKAKANANRSVMEKLADFMTSKFGSNTFLSLNVLLFAFWWLVNSGTWPIMKPFDPFPYNFLTMLVSLEAIILAIFVLISQNRTSKIDDLREEIHLQLDIISERELTKLMKMTVLILNKHGIDLSEDAELKEMLQPVSEDEIQKELEQEIF